MNGLTGPVSPAIQLRIALGRARANGREFDEAWEFAFGNVRWPHDTTHRREWKAILSAPDTVEAWRLAFYNEPCVPRQLAVARLVAA